MNKLIVDFSISELKQLNKENLIYEIRNQRRKIEEEISKYDSYSWDNKKKKRLENKIESLNRKISDLEGYIIGYKKIKRIIQEFLKIPYKNFDSDTLKKKIKEKKMKDEKLEEKHE